MDCTQSGLSDMDASLIFTLLLHYILVVLQARQFRWLRTLPWKSRIDRSIGVGQQCQLRVEEVCGPSVISGLLNRNEATRRQMITFLTELIHVAKVIGELVCVGGEGLLLTCNNVTLQLFM